ncbi:TPA: hypothetical protein TUV09_001824 [Streptococcus equi subsp. zooepidemicus]|nr:hypothetical protein [Streptococcus equi subsp. zooepidemicus]
MIELTQKQAEYVEFARKTIVDPDMMEFAGNTQLINHALLVGYCIVDEEVTE